MKIRQVIPGVLAATLLLGCAGCASVPDPFTPGAGIQRPVQLTVQNNDFNDAVIYANWQGGARHRVGLAVGKTTQTFTFDKQGEVVQFDVDFIAGASIPGDPISVIEGDHFNLVIMNDSSSR